MSWHTTERSPETRHRWGHHRTLVLPKTPKTRGSKGTGVLSFLAEWLVFWLVLISAIWGVSAMLDPMGSSGDDVVGLFESVPKSRDLTGVKCPRGSNPQTLDSVG